MLINLAERGKVQGEYAWTGSKDFLSKRYGVSSNTIENGMRLLKRYDVIDIEYSRYSAGRMHIGPSVYRYKGLYDLREVNTKLMELEERYGGIFYKARKYAGVLRSGRGIDVPEG